MDIATLIAIATLCTTSVLNSALLALIVYKLDKLLELANRDEGVRLGRVLQLTRTEVK